MSKDNDMATKLGTRRLQHGTHSYTLTIPAVAIDTLDLEPHAKLDIFMVNNEYITIKKAKK